MAQLQIGGNIHAMLMRQTRKYSKTKRLLQRKTNVRSCTAFGIPNSMWVCYFTVITCTRPWTKPVILVKIIWLLITIKLNLSLLKRYRICWHPFPTHWKCTALINLTSDHTTSWKCIPVSESTIFMWLTCNSTHMQREHTKLQYSKRPVLYCITSYTACHL